ncbi:MAG: hypothetical protein ACOC0E_14165 [Spirochaetota bacterium]
MTIELMQYIDWLDSWAADLPDAHDVFPFRDQTLRSALPQRPKRPADHDCATWSVLCVGNAGRCTIREFRRVFGLVAVFVAAVAGCASGPDRAEVPGDIPDFFLVPPASGDYVYGVDTGAEIVDGSEAAPQYRA